MKIQVAQVVLVLRSRPMVGRAGTTRVCWSTYETHTTASRVSVNIGPTRRASVLAIFSLPRDNCGPKMLAYYK